jgi:cation diffusion facilitator family transporter
MADAAGGPDPHPDASIPSAARAAAHDSKRVVITALLANVGVTAAFTLAAVVTGSASMLAQALHGGADTGNQAILYVAETHSRSQRDAAHIEAGRAAYFWALVAALSVFVIGGTLSVFEGVRTLIDGESATYFYVAYAVTAVAMGLDGFSWFQAFRQTRREAARRDREFLSQLVEGSDPTTRAVFGEDSAALIGDALALVAVALHQLTGSSVFDALGSIAIGLLLGTLAVLLARRNLDFLVGQSPSPADTDQMRRLLESLPGIDNLDELFVTFVGPRQLWVVARINIDERLSSFEVVALSAAADQLVRERAPEVVRIDLVPAGVSLTRAPTPDPPPA